MNTEFNCVHCGKDECLEHWAEDCQNEMKDSKMCFNCNYWHTASLEQNAIIIDGRYYVDAGVSEPRPFLGFGGRWFNIRMLDGSRTFLTNNLWNGSRIPDDWLIKFPNNAEFIKNEHANVA